MTNRLGCTRNRSRLVGLLLAFVVVRPLTVSAQLWQERLAPPQTFPMQALARPESSQPRATKYPDRLPSHLWQLPVASIATVPQILASERAMSRWRRPSIDTPLLAVEHHPERPSTPALLTRPRAYVASFDPWQVPAVERGKSLGEIAARPADDPSAVANYRGLIVPVTTPPAGLTPFEKLRIPEPAPQLQAIRLPTPISELDGPATSQQRSPTPVLKDP